MPLFTPHSAQIAPMPQYAQSIRAQSAHKSLRSLCPSLSRAFLRRLSLLSRAAVGQTPPASGFALPCPPSLGRFSLLGARSATPGAGLRLLRFLPHSSSIGTSCGWVAVSRAPSAPFLRRSLLPLLLFVVSPSLRVLRRGCLRLTRASLAKMPPPLPGYAVKAAHHATVVSVLFLPRRLPSYCCAVSPFPRFSPHSASIAPRFAWLRPRSAWFQGLVSVLVTPM